MSTIKERTEIARESKRDIPSILKEIEMLSTISDDVALSCFYVVFDKKDNKPFIGISVRFAELIASSWGNIHAGAKIVSSNGMKVTIQGFVHDFEKNAVFTVEVQRATGGLSHEKYIQVTNAASSIAFRNAVFKAIPAAITQSIIKNIRKYILEVSEGSVLTSTLDYFYSKKVNNEELNNLLGCDVSSIDSEKLFLLIGLRNAIEEGDTTISEVFNRQDKVKPVRSSKFNFSESQFENDYPKEEIENLESNKPKVKVQEIIVSDFESPKNKLKEEISSLANSIHLEEEIEIEEKPKEEIKKRGRGRPKKKD